MKTIHNFAGGPALALLLGPWCEVVAQSKIAEATNWFNLAVQEKEPARKIAAYQKAISLDPNFVEALYNLGVLYKQQSDHQNAGQYLGKALTARPERLKAELKLQILYELAVTQKKLGKAGEAEQNFRAARALAPANEVRAAVVLEISRLLIEQGRHGEAAAELKTALNLEPRSSKRQSEMQKLLQLAEEEIERQRLYAAVENAKAGGNLQEAKRLLEQIKAKKPEDKTIDALLTAVESAQQAATQEKTWAAMREQAQRHAAAGNWELAIAVYETMLQQNPADQDARAGLATAHRRLQQKQQEDRLESEYAAGLAALKARDWTRAILAFEKVSELDHNFREVRKHLAEAQSGLDRESSETIVARYYAEGVTAMNRNDLGAALAALEKVRRINPSYRETTALLAEIESALHIKDPVPATAMLDSLYRVAEVAFERQDWTQAIVALEKIRMVQPDYRDVVDRLAQTRVQRTLAQESGGAKNVAVVEVSSDKNRGLYIGTLLVLLTAFAAVVISPTMRARFYLLRGNYAAAAQLYEKLLTRHPNRVKLYAALANVYLLMGRTDDKALRVFKAVLQLNLAVKNHDAISAIVAQNYLTQGRIDSDAIAVLEDALKAEQRRHKA
ncbi:MAG: tetratricopeptide repeat protein [candidate division KSB1 bacterium]|nr:tetratricopeptide repeat protein [candidate division KSB1 bacterium]MDZ7274090.1 tetratricopeptide repeat protein [candidate division KSB1 bacterium]MDZ7287865.1 tetratricopeptide repeat protein [candidate division KSB1 bacterium]MDZ7296689.1 tetratricopeptide repeat protein [candidate division KSB1 bacterium]MDZ7306941.1 tetratricopeptide repeat protein [candidate division KSB1 bacterium]